MKILMENESNITLEKIKWRYENYHREAIKHYFKESNKMNKL
jgi:hypothetical protein